MTAKERIREALALLYSYAQSGRPVDPHDLDKVARLLEPVLVELDRVVLDPALGDAE
jgi:hypothetical protein